MIQKAEKSFRDELADAHLTLKNFASLTNSSIYTAQHWYYNRRRTSNLAKAVLRFWKKLDPQVQKELLDSTR